MTSTFRMEKVVPAGMISLRRNRGTLPSLLTCVWARFPRRPFHLKVDDPVFVRICNCTTLPHSIEPTYRCIGCPT